MQLPVLGPLIGALRQLTQTSIQSAIWVGIAAVAALAAIGFFLTALYTWVSSQLGSVYGALVIGGGLLVVAVIILGARLILQRRAMRRIKHQHQVLLVQPATLATRAAIQALGFKQTTILMLAALSAGWLFARPWRGPQQHRGD